MRSFLIEPRRGLVLGSFSKRGDGWSFLPFTTAHRASRKAHATQAGACVRYMTQSAKIIEAESVADASRQAKALQPASV